ncbi:RecQ family ATP-dependent DNA helicase [Mycolicibacterium fortuitum]|uniref:RecQ family ATP-dependent DNA helicase n=1 Tax=Mycolicibacterium fortuitum TaxID=1766 RepID=UPI00241E8CFB|nr:RecQ family ATP-dependent DNA helicase [Mycolicibacterium fortuitum]MDG5769159.1 RecQ family ATP-dependent DNA helicase [Mycolicibacterium fortuitum]MDG5779979.1 RecQ family ATP-dependent DNA helicase [Mycolicibacterium fortuitum]
MALQVPSGVLSTSGSDLHVGSPFYYRYDRRDILVVEFHETRARQLLRAGSGIPDAEFRDDQVDAIRHVVEGRGRLLVVQRTGWGKSFVYFIATKLLREAGLGPVLLVSPLLALMRNQIEAARRMGLSAEALHTEIAEAAQRQIETDFIANKVDILLVTPERFANDQFRSEVLAQVAGNISLLVVDEAHCISDWGHDFRPQYRLLGRIITTLPRNLRVLATTATANDRVMHDLEDVLGPNLHVIRGELSRDSLSLQSIVLPSQAARLAWLAEHLTTIEGSGIVYTLTVRDAHLVADWLESRGVMAKAYTSKSGDEREPLEQALLNNDVKALVATTALGMGFDKPDLAFVIHFQTPGSVVAYYQQVGRAGRAMDSAYGVLLSGSEDTDITGWFIKSAFPTRDEVAAILGQLEANPDGLSTQGLTALVNVRKGRIDKAIELLMLESPSPITKVGSKWQLTATTLSDEFWSRADRLTEQRHNEQDQMQEYVALPFGEHMPFLIGALDGNAAGVRPPALPPLSAEVGTNLLQEATAFLRRTHVAIEPRKKWPEGGLPVYGVRGNTNIPGALQAQPGRALCMWGDAGWGSIVKNSKYRDGRFGDELVEACAVMVEEWSPDPTPMWVTAMPSLSHPELVPDFAKRLAEVLDLPFLPVLTKVDARPAQKEMNNSAQQARNVDGSLGIIDGALLSGPVLLVDDMVDSRWTMTIAAWLLLSAGSGPVYPLALALTGGDE